MIRGIVTETSFGFSTEHNYSGPEDVGGIGKLLQGAAGMATNFSQAAGMIGGGTNDLLQTVTGKGLDEHIKDIREKTTTESNGVSMIGDILDFARSHAGGAFITSYDYIKTFKGTSTNFELPQLETRIYHDLPTVAGATTVKTAVEKLNLAFIGGISENIQLFAFQEAPNKYLPSFKGIPKSNESDPIPGTFLLKYGPFQIPNLLISNFSIRFSTFYVREGLRSNKESGVKKGEFLYADVKITLMPCTYVSRDLLTSVIKNLSY